VHPYLSPGAQRMQQQAGSALRADEVRR
jgi:hypothetical protein